MIVLAVLAGGIYVLVIASFFYGWERLRSFTRSDSQPLMLVSIVIPVRNEANHIPDLLRDLEHQSYASEYIEIIAVDDHSNDNSLQLLEELKPNNLKIISLQNGSTGKKAALSVGIRHAKGELILTTDADCRIHRHWVWTMTSFYLHMNPVMILAPVLPLRGADADNGFHGIFSLELFSLLGSTAGSAAIGHPVMGNGANLAFPKKIFPDIEHIYTENQVASGDDIFAMLALKKKYPGQVQFLKSDEAAVYSNLPNDFVSFFRQRSRWAGKSIFYRDAGILATGFIVLLVNVLLLVMLVSGALQLDLWPFIILLIVKSLVDFPFLCRVTSFFGAKKLIRWFPVAQSFYFFYVCITVFWALLVPNVWKERKI